MKLITIFANNNIIYEHDRDKVLDERQIAFLGKMDGHMDRGIKIQGELITHPDIKQRTTFFAMNLLKALKQENNAIIAHLFNPAASRLDRSACQESRQWFDHWTGGSALQTLKKVRV